MEKKHIPDRLKRLEAENLRLRHSIRELSVLNEIAVAISSTLSLDEIIDLIIQKCVKHFRVEQAAVMLLKENEEKADFRTMVRRADRSDYRQPYRLNAQLTGWMLKHRRPLLINDFQTDDRFASVQPKKFSIHSLLAVPLMLKNRIIGLICLFNKKEEGQFTPDDQRLLAILATESAQVIENARLYREEQEFRRMQEELRMASQIQRDLLPKEIPQPPGYDIAAVNIPARMVSGDYYDFIPLPDSRLAFCLGDVSGKGMPAALLMANLQATLRGQVLLGLPVRKCIQNTNFLLHSSTSSEKYATLFFGILDYRSHRLGYCNAGHDNPLFFSPEKPVSRLQTGGIVVGFMKEFAFEEAAVPFGVSDVLLIYSDGITEAMNSRGKEFGEQRLQHTVETALKQPSRMIIERVLTELNTFTGNAPQADDITLVVIKRVAGEK